MFGISQIQIAFLVHHKSLASDKPTILCKGFFYSNTKLPLNFKIYRKVTNGYNLPAYYFSHFCSMSV